MDLAKRRLLINAAAKPLTPEVLVLPPVRKEVNPWPYPTSQSDLAAAACFVLTFLKYFHEIPSGQRKFSIAKTLQSAESHVRDAELGVKGFTPIQTRKVIDRLSNIINQLGQFAHAHELNDTIAELRVLEGVSEVKHSKTFSADIFSLKESLLFQTLETDIKQLPQYQTIYFANEGLAHYCETVSKQFVDCIRIQYPHSSGLGKEKGAELAILAWTFTTLIAASILQKFNMKIDDSAMGIAVMGPIATFVSQLTNAVLVSSCKQLEDKLAIKLSDDPLYEVAIETNTLKILGEVPKSNRVAPLADRCSTIFGVLNHCRNLKVRLESFRSANLPHFQNMLCELSPVPEYPLIRPHGKMLFMKQSDSDPMHWLTYHFDSVTRAEGVGVISPDIEGQSSIRWSSSQIVSDIACSSILTMSPCGHFSVTRNFFLRNEEFSLSEQEAQILETIRESMQGEVNRAMLEFPDLFAFLNLLGETILIKSRNGWYIALKRAERTLLSELIPLEEVPQNDLLPLMRLNPLELRKIAYASDPHPVQSASVSSTEAVVPMRTKDERTELVKAIRREISYNDLLKILSQFDVREDDHRGQGVHPILIRITESAEKKIYLLATDMESDPNYLSLFIPRIVRTLGIPYTQMANAVNEYFGST